MKLGQKSKLILAAGFCCLLWGTAIPVLKIMYKELQIPSSDMFSKLLLAGLRFLIASLLIALFVRSRDKRIDSIKGKQWLSVFIFGLLNTTLQYFFFYVGVGNTGAIKGVLIDTSKPLMVVVLAHIFTKDDKITKEKIIGLMLGTLGILMVNVNALSKGAFELSMSFEGEGFLLFASLVYAIAVIYGKKVMKTMRSTILNLYQMLIGSVLLLIVGLIGTGGFYLSFSPLTMGLLIYSSALSAIAFVLWYHLIHRYSASAVTIYVFLIPVFGTTFSSIIFPEEHLSLTILASLVLMSLSIYLVNKKPATS